jgi:hypothetical protein
MTNVSGILLGIALSVRFAYAAERGTRMLPPLEKGGAGGVIRPVAYGLPSAPAARR